MWIRIDKGDGIFEEKEFDSRLECMMFIMEHEEITYKFLVDADAPEEYKTFRNILK
jgi:hypothetical protein